MARKTVTAYPPIGRARADARVGVMLQPLLAMTAAAVEGKAHSADWWINEPEHGYLTPAKLLAITANGLLYEDAASAKEILANFERADGQRGLSGLPAWALPQAALRLHRRVICRWRRSERRSPAFRFHHPQATQR